MSTHPVIALKGQPVIDEECTAAAAILPGHLIELVAGGSTCRKHSTAADAAARTFALERGEMGKGVTDAYATSDRVKRGHFSAGDRVLARVAAAAPAIVINDKLESAGDGTLRKVVTDAATDDTERHSIVGIAREAVDNSGGGAEVFIVIEII